jgi:uncharacterized membrane protein
MIGPVELVVAAFDDEDKASAVLKDLKQADKDGVLQVINAAVLVKKENGKVSFHETQDVGAGRGAIFGAIAGGLVGLLGGPAGVIVGAAAGAATGGVAAKQIDMGFSDEMLKDMQAGLQPGSSAIVALVQHEWVDRVVAALEELDAKLFRQALTEEIAAQLAEAEEAKEE